MRWIPRQPDPVRKDLRRMRELDAGLAALGRVAGDLTFVGAQPPVAHSHNI